MKEYQLIKMRKLFRDWGMPIFLGMACLMMMGLWVEDQRVVSAKLRIAADRQAIAETRKTVQSINTWLQNGQVPQRLEKVEARQKVVLDLLERMCNHHLDGSFQVAPSCPGRPTETNHAR